MLRHRTAIVWGICALGMLGFGVINPAVAVTQNGITGVFFAVFLILLGLEVGLILWRRSMFGYSHWPERYQRPEPDQEYIPRRAKQRKPN